LEQEFSEENLDFWTEVENYRKLKTKRQQKEAERIFEIYIKVGSVKEVSRNGMH